MATSTYLCFTDFRPSFNGSAQALYLLEFLNFSSIDDIVMSPAWFGGYRPSCQPTMFVLLTKKEIGSQRNFAQHRKIQIDAIFENTSLDYPTIRRWFSDINAHGYVRLEVPAAHARGLAEHLGLSIRRCYLSDNSISELLSEKTTEQELIAACLPDRGSTMAGDFGEILAYIFNLADKGSLNLKGPKKWRLKDNRRMPSPMSDVVQFALPHWPTASAADQLLCSEVKIKSTKSNFRPITDALDHSRKDRASRLAKTLIWLRERTILKADTDVTREQLDRFINAAENPMFLKSFNAVAIVCNGLIEDELQADRPPTDPHHQIVVIGVHELKNTYEQVFDAVAQAGLPSGATP